MSLKISRRWASMYPSAVPMSQPSNSRHESGLMSLGELVDEVLHETVHAGLGGRLQGIGLRLGEPQHQHRPGDRSTGLGGAPDAATEAAGQLERRLEIEIVVLGESRQHGLGAIAAAPKPLYGLLASAH